FRGGEGLGRTDKGRVWGRDAGVGAGAAELDAQGTGDRRLGPAGVGVGMPAAVAPADTQRSAAVMPDAGGCQSDEATAQPGRDIVEHNIEPGGRRAEFIVASAMRTDSVVQRVDRLVNP